MCEYYLDKIRIYANTIYIKVGKVCNYRDLGEKKFFGRKILKLGVGWEGFLELERRLSPPLLSVLVYMLVLL